MDRQLPLRWGALGMLSGTVATVTVFLPHWLSFAAALETAVDILGIGLFLSPLSLLPGLVFGLVIGWALRHAGIATGGTYPAYILAATLSYFVAVQFTINVLIEVMNSPLTVGIAAGMLGAALLTAATAALMPDFRQIRLAARMVLAGALAGSALYFTLAWDHFFGWLLLFAPWQAAFAAAMGTVGGNARR